MIRLLPGDKVLVYFPVNKQSKLFGNWKGVYRIQEQIDVNTFIVAEEGQMRKKYIVDRRRIRTLGEKIDIFDEAEEAAAKDACLAETDLDKTLNRESAQIDFDVNKGESVPDVTVETPESAGNTNDPQGIVDEGPTVAEEDMEAEITPEPVEEIPEENQRPRRAAQVRGRQRIREWVRDDYV